MRGWCWGCGISRVQIALGYCVLLLCANAQAASVGVASAPIRNVSAPAALPSSDQRAILTLIVDDDDHGETEAIVRDKDILVSVADLEKAGMHSLGGTREVVYGKEMVSLDSLAPAITYKFDDQNLNLMISVGANKLKAHDLNLGLHPPAGMEFRADTSAFFNYSSILTGLSVWNGFFESGVSYKGILFYSGLNASTGGNAVTRGLTNITYDDQPDMRRTMLGDTAVTSGILGSTELLGGLSVAKDFSLDPYFLRSPTQDVAGILTTPSTVNVYRNGVLIKQEYLPPGSFNLNNIPGQVGQGNTQVVIRDALGNTRQINTPYYLGSQLLTEGLSDYDYGIGFDRNNLNSSFTYGEPSLSAYHLYGLTNWLTVGGRLEAQHNLISGGPTVPVGSFLG